MPNAMSKATLLARLQELGVHPSKMLGQNFLLDPNLAQAIVAAIEPRSGDHIVEIGPGMGALTRHLVDSPASRITLLERDHRFVEELKRRYENDRVQVIGGDAAKIDLRQLYGWGPVKVIGNLPYSASTAIIAHFTEALSPACCLVFMLQREVAERLVARPGDHDYAALTVLLGRRWSVKKTRVVPPEVFWPRPHVESAIVELKPYKVSELLPCDEAEFKKNREARIFVTSQKTRFFAQKGISSCCRNFGKIETGAYRPSGRFRTPRVVFTSKSTESSTSKLFARAC